MPYTSPYTGVSVTSNLLLKLEAAQSHSGKILALKETTGDYNVSTNPSGFGTPNPERTDVGSVLTSTGILIEVIRPEDTSYTYGLDVPVTFINPGTANTFEINPEDIGYTADTVLPDGVYTIRYLVEDANQTGFLPIATKYIVLAHNAKCRVHNALAKVTCEDCCNGGSTDDALATYAMYKSMLYNAAMGKIDKVKEQLACINSSDCGCGCS